MSKDSQTIPPAQELALSTLITPTERGIASRVLARTAGGNVTLFAFDAGQGLEEHTSPFSTLVIVLEGALVLTIGGAAVRATPGSIVRMPGGVPHAVDAPEATRMLLIMLRDVEGARLRASSSTPVTAESRFVDHGAGGPWQAS